LHGCNSQPSPRDTAEIIIATTGNNIISFPVDITIGVMDTSAIRRISGDSTQINIPIDIEVNNENKLFILSQGHSNVPAKVLIFSDSATGNAAPERVIDVTGDSGFKPIGLTITTRTDFIYVSYFSQDTSRNQKIVRFPIGSGIRAQFEFSMPSLGDIEMDPSGQFIHSVDPLGKKLIKFRVSSNFDIQPGFDIIQGSNTGLRVPNSIALTNDGTIYVFDKEESGINGRINIYGPNSIGNTAPVRVTWGFCPGNKRFITPYGLTVAEHTGIKVIAACDAQGVTTFLESSVLSDSTGCTNFIQQLDLREFGDPIAVTWERVKFQ
ncbi:MAG: hypothetical protein HOP31_03995, partial [Ignavibacteria bacterium]|nr:hypothetical protein [Ignavibacteria bacterium]